VTSLPGYDAWKTRSDDDGRFDDRDGPCDDCPLEGMDERVAQLEAALKPFADAFHKADDPGMSDLDGDQPLSLHVALGHWRFAWLLVGTLAKAGAK
jgi:hypothetical protein